MQGKTGFDSTSRQWLVLPTKPRGSSPLLVSRCEKCKRAFRQAHYFAGDSTGGVRQEQQAGAQPQVVSSNIELADDLLRAARTTLPASHHPHVRCGDQLSGSAQCPDRKLPTAHHPMQKRP